MCLARTAVAEALSCACFCIAINLAFPLLFLVLFLGALGLVLFVFGLVLCDLRRYALLPVVSGCARGMRCACRCALVFVPLCLVLFLFVLCSLFCLIFPSCILRFVPCPYRLLWVVLVLFFVVFVI